jgi:hypothetical protein
MITILVTTVESRFIFNCCYADQVPASMQLVSSVFLYNGFRCTPPLSVFISDVSCNMLLVII